ncbi:MAG: hypothetical protein P1P82_02275 [Bacteroidales bacterium]|nr:hypothetical protein [Bacteroidales bacterium]MDT8431126.1 hypothetical protein [Bacteroidales bacterium]
MRNWTIGMNPELLKNLLSISVILVLAYFERPAESSVALMTVLIGIPAYYIFRSKQ